MNPEESEDLSLLAVCLVRLVVTLSAIMTLQTATAMICLMWLEQNVTYY